MQRVADLAIIALLSALLLFLGLPFLQWLADSVLLAYDPRFGALFWVVGGPLALIPFVAIGLIFRGTVRKPSG